MEEQAMAGAFQAVKVTENVYWVGAIDWDIRNFHGYLTSRGSTYNAYLIMADKPVLIDTVKPPFFSEMLARITSVIDPKKIEYIVSNHSEMDHSGSLVQAVETIKPAKIFASKMGQRALEAHFHSGYDITAVADGEVLDLGNMNLTCIETRMCHWPDSMVTYLDADEILFSQDIFGMHLASSKRFADEMDRETLDYEAAKYFANILMHLSRSVIKTIDKVAELGISLSMVAPDHGPIWRSREDIGRIIDCYNRWSRHESINKAVVLYDSMWGSTATMARAIGDGLASQGAGVELMSMDSCHRSDVVAELLDAGALVVGSPTLNNNLFPSIAEAMCYIKGLRPTNLVAAAFGSFGWSGEAPRQLHATLEDIGLTMVAEPLRVRYVPDNEALAACRQLGVTTAKAMKAMISGEEIPVDRETPPQTPAPAPVSCSIDVNNGDRTLQGDGAKSLLEILWDNGILIPTICGGQGRCGCCKVRVIEGGSTPTSAENDYLTAEQLAGGLRLACQIHPPGDMKIIVREELLDSKPFRGRLESVTDLTHDMKLFRIALSKPKRIDFVPGQYVKLDLPVSVEPTMSSRAFSIASTPADDGCIELIVKLTPGGVCTNWMFKRLKVGQPLAFSGPYGEFRLSDSDAEMIWIAGGSGLSTFWSILRHMKDRAVSRKCTLYFGVESASDLYLVDELRELERELDWFTFVPALSAPADGDDWTGETGLISDVLDRRLTDGDAMEAYLCGRPVLISAAMGVLRLKGVSPERIFFDEFTRSDFASK